MVAIVRETDQGLVNVEFTPKYRNYILSDDWKKFRARYMNSGMPTDCIVCGASLIVLHHLTYDRLGREELTDVVPLCKCHHDRLHYTTLSRKEFRPLERLRLHLIETFYLKAEEADRRLQPWREPNPERDLRREMMRRERNQKCGKKKRRGRKGIKNRGMKCKRRSFGSGVYRPEIAPRPKGPCFAKIGRELTPQELADLESRRAERMRVLIGE